MAVEIIKPIGIGVRHGQVILHFLFYAIVSGIQISFPLTVIGMIEGMDSSPNHKSFNWSMATFSTLIGSYSLGFAITELFGGWICIKIGFKWPMVVLMVMISFVTLNIPSITKRYDSGGLMFCRIGQGFFAGLATTMPVDAVSRWIPVQERTTLGTTIYASGRFGDVIGIVLSYYLRTSSEGWPSVFIQYGYLAIIWAILMAIFGADSPEEYRYKIPEPELIYIVNNRGNAKPKSKVKIPWIRILTSMPFWAIVVAQIGATWLLSVLASDVPIYLYSFYNVRAENPAISITSFTTLVSWILSFPISGIAEHLINERKTTIEQSRKIFNATGCIVPAFVLIYLALKPSGSEAEAITLASIISVATIGTISGSKLSCNDISPNFAPIISSIATWIGFVLNLYLHSLFVSLMFDFYSISLFTVVLLLVTNAFYVKFASGQEQEWDSHKDVFVEEVDVNQLYS